MTAGPEAQVREKVDQTLRKAGWTDPEVTGTFDLAPIAAFYNRTTRAVRIGFVGITVGTAALTSLGAYRFATGTAPPASISLLAATGLATVILSIICLKLRSPPISLTISGSILRVGEKGGHQTLIDMAAPRIRLNLREWSDFTRMDQTYPWRHEIVRLLSPNVLLTPELFSSILALGRRQGLVVRRKETTAIWYGAAFYSYSLTRAARIS